MGVSTWLGDQEPKRLDPSFEYDDIRSPHSLSVSPRQYFFSLFIYLFWARVFSLSYHWGRPQRCTCTKRGWAKKRCSVERERERKLTPSSSKSPFSHLWIPPFFVLLHTKEMSIFYLISGIHNYLRTVLVNETHIGYIYILHRKESISGTERHQ